MIPSMQYLRECFDYNPETGELRWRKRPLHHFNGNEKSHAKWNKDLSGKKVKFKYRDDYPDKLYIPISIYRDGIRVQTSPNAAYVVIMMVHGHEAKKVQLKDNSVSCLIADNLIYEIVDPTEPKSVKIQKPKKLSVYPTRFNFWDESEKRWRKIVRV